MIYTPEQLAEFVKCKEDPAYFTDTYSFIEHPTKGVIPFKLYPFQREILKKYKDGQFNVLNKSRQTGISTLTASFALWLVMFHIDKNVIIISMTDADAMDFLRKVKTAYYNLPPWLKGAPILDNAHELELTTGSRIKSVPSSLRAGRGKSPSLLIIDECAHIELIEDIWTSAFPSLSKGGKGILISCVTEDTFVFTNKGIKQIKNFIDHSKQKGYEIGKYNVLGKDKIREGSLFFNSGLAPTRKITTTNSFIEGSLEHKLWSCKQGHYNWYKLGELEKGDFVAIQYGNNIWGNNDKIEGFVPSKSNKMKINFCPSRITPEIAYFLGIFLAEGYGCRMNKNNKFIGGNVTLTCGDFVGDIFNKIGLQYLCYDKMHYKSGKGSKNLIEFLEFLGFDLSLKAKNKIIPDRLLEMSKENIVAMLRGIFDGDGYSRKDKGYVGIGLSSKKMIEQIRMLLLNFGILTTYQECICKPTKKVKTFGNSYRLEMNGGFSKKFYEIIGFNFNRKQDNQIILENNNFDRSCSKDIIPFSLEIMRKLYKFYDGNSSDLRDKDGLNIRYLTNDDVYKTNHIGRKNVIKMYELVKENLSKQECIEFDKIICENIKWDVIKEINESEAEVYDFSLPNNTEDFWAHSIIYNGIVGHQTPNGVGNFFHKTWERAKTGSNEFTWTFVHWSQVPEYDQVWYERMRKQVIDQREWAQEYEGDFIASGDTVIEGWRLKQFKDYMTDKTTQNWLNFPIEQRIDNKLWIFKKAIIDHAYVCAVDTSTGSADDFSAFEILDINEQEQVAEFRGKMQINEFSKTCVEICKEYNEAFMIVENNGIGLATVNKIYNDLGYQNFYMMENNRTGKITKIPGFNITKARPLVIGAIQRFFMEGIWKFYSERLYNEMLTFIWNNGKAQAAHGYNDDCIISLGIAFLMSEHTMRMRPINVYNNELGDNNLDIEDSTTNLRNQSQLENIDEEPMDPKTYAPTKEQETDDLSWLY